LTPKLSTTNPGNNSLGACPENVLINPTSPVMVISSGFIPKAVSLTPLAQVPPVIKLSGVIPP